MKKVIAAILTAVLLLFCTACQTEKAAKEGGAAVFLPVESGQPERLAEETPAPSSDAIPFPQGGEPINLSLIHIFQQRKRIANDTAPFIFIAG